MRSSGSRSRVNIAGMAGSVGCHSDGYLRVVNWCRMDRYCVGVVAMSCVANHVRPVNKSRPVNESRPVMHVSWMMRRMHKSCVICPDMVSRGRM